MRAEWIWIDENAEKDSYVRFYKKFYSSEKSVKVRISCDSVFCAYVNGEIIGFSACADYPWHKLYEEFNVDINREENELEILVWYFGEASQTYLPDKAGVWFKISDTEKTLAVSDEQTLAKEELRFRNGYKKTITYQLGYSFYFDNTIEFDFPQSRCVLTGKKDIPEKRPQKNLFLDERVPVEYRQGKTLLVDFGKEYAGYPDLDFYSPCEQELVISFGEHIENGSVNRFIGGRDFSIEFKAKKGDNKWFMPLRRIAGRYFEISCKEPIVPHYVGLRPAYYPVNEAKVRCDDEFKSIYETSVRTLLLCMHEHYEDCPWREQALYAMDSRNQMLFGYYAFSETEYPRSNLLLMSNGVRSDGLLSLCFPSGIDIPIPSFSLAYILEVCEYIEQMGDKSILYDVRQAIRSVLRVFAEKIDDNDLVPTFPYPFWNFYEWSDDNHREWEITRKGNDLYNKDYDLILNCLLVYVCGKYSFYDDTDIDVAKIKKAIRKTFFVREKGLYKNSRSGEKFSQLGNALACLIGIGNDEILKKVASIENMTKATLSMKTFVYDALLSEKEKYKEIILNDIKQTYQRMLDCGATSFWETEQGYKDFNGAGSLCHGWSALPVYYLNILGKVKTAE